MAIINETDGSASQGQALSDLQQVTSSMTLVIDPNTMTTLKILIYYVLQIPVLVLGMGTNTLVITTFIKCGLNESVTISFFALAVSDLGYCILYFIVRFSSVMQRVLPQPLYLRGDFLSYVVSYYGLFFNDTSVLITVFTSVQKCCCVAIPHLFKNVFTPRRAVIVVVVINCVLLCLYGPLNQSFRLEPKSSKSTNRTFVSLRVLPLFQKVSPVWQVFSRIVLPMTAQSIVLVCLGIMSYKLRQSVKFRTGSTNQQDSNNSAKPTDSNRLGPKETRALAAVTVVSAIFVIATIPGTLLYYFHLIFPILSQPRFRNVEVLVFNSQNIFIHVNASVNLFVYLRYNTKFTETFRGLWGPCIACERDKVQE